MAESRQTVLSVSVTGVVKIVLVLLGFWFLYIIRDVVVITVIALFLAALIDPFADWFQKKHIPRSIAVLLIYILLLGLVSLLVALIAPPLRHDIPQLVENLEAFWGRVTRGFVSVPSFDQGFVASLQQNLQVFSEGSDQFWAGALSTIRGAIGFVAGFVIMLVMAFYMVVEEDALKSFFRRAAPAGVHTYLAEMLGRVQNKIGHWLRGQLLLSAAVGILVYLGLLMLGVRSAIALALLAALAEFIPYIGPVFAAIPAVALAFADTPLKGLLAIILYVVVQQLENNLLVPKIMQRAIGLNPIVSIVSLLIGARVGGVIGAILAIPLATAITVFVTDYFELKRSRPDAV